MKKNILAGILIASLSFTVFAGDAAVFVDNGFSSDGSVYIFSQYGKTDKSYEGWAEIYTVSIEKNTFVSGEVFRTDPSALTRDKNGKAVYESLAGKSFSTLDKYGCHKTAPEQTLYICGSDDKPGTAEIQFKDFGAVPVEQQGVYHIQLVPTVNGSGKNVSSSFVIMLEKDDASGAVIGRQKIGSPSVLRKGVSGYKIQQIFCDKSGKNIVFVVEKTIEDKSGVLIRYMIEAATLDDSLKITPVSKK